MSVANIKKLIEQSSNYDAHFRSMALLDLTKEILSGGHLDKSMQVPVRNALIARLRDANSDVKTAAVKLLTDCLSRFDSEQIIYIADQLVKMVVDKKAAGFEDDEKKAEGGEGGASTWEASLHDVADGLSNLVSSISEDDGKKIAPNLAVNLIKGLSKKPGKGTEQEMVCLDLVQQVVKRLGTAINGEEEAKDAKTNTDKIMTACQQLLKHPSDTVQQRASATLGALVLILSEESFKTLMNDIVNNLLKNKDPGLYIKTLGAVSQAAGLRVAESLAKFMPRLLSLLKYDEKKKSDKDDEARILLFENCLNTLAAVLRSCPTKVSDYVDEIVAVSVKLVSYDPLYSEEAGGDEGGGESWGEGGGDDGGDDWGGGGGGGGDDWGGSVNDSGVTLSSDESFKVRRAAIAVLSTFINVRSDLVKAHYSEVCEKFIARFKERDPSVQEAILLATRDLLREGVVVDKGQTQEEEEGIAPPKLIRTLSLKTKIDDKTDDIVKGLEAQFKKGEPKIKKAIFMVLEELIIVKQGDVGGHIAVLAPHIVAGVSAEGKDALITTEAIKFLHLLLEYHGYDDVKDQIMKFTEALLAVVKRGKLNVAEALQTLGSVVAKIAGKSHDAVIKTIFDVTYSRLEEKDTPENIKIAAIRTVGALLAHFSSTLAKQVSNTLKLLDQRLANETTRKAVLRALTKIALTDSKCDLKQIIVSGTKEICSFMRKAEPELKHLSASCLEALIRTQNGAFDKKTYSEILTEVSPHIGDVDLLMAAGCLKLLSTCLRVTPQTTAEQIGSSIVERAIKLVTSPLLQGQALDALIDFFQHCVQVTGNKSLSYATLLPALLKTVTPELAKDNVRAVAKCIAGMTQKIPKGEANATVTKFIADLKAKTPHTKHIALLGLGEIGRKQDLTEHKGLDAAVFSAFSDPDVANAAAYALGNICVGNLGEYLPILLKLLKENEERLYLLLSSLNEIIRAVGENAESQVAFSSSVDTVTGILTKYIEHKDEGVRQIVAESLGRLTVFEPAKFLQLLVNMAKNKNNLQRQVGISALKFSFSPNMAWPLLAKDLETFLVLLKDPDLEVKRQACVTLESLMLANIELLQRAIIDKIVLPALYAENKERKELLEEKDYYAFKVTIDHGLPLRKAVYGSLGTLLRLSHKRLDLQEFIGNVRHGLTDNQSEVQIATFEIFNDIARDHPAALLEYLEQLPDHLIARVKVLIKEGKEDKTGQKARDVLRSFVTSMLIFNKVQGVDQCHKYNKFFKQVCATPLLKKMADEIEKTGAPAAE